MADIEAGAVTQTNKTTLLRGRTVDGGPFVGDEIFIVVPGVGTSAPAGNVDGIVAAGNNDAVGVMGQGASGVVGYAQPVARDKAAEVFFQAGVLGLGGVSSGVVGVGDPGVRADGGEKLGVWAEALGGTQGTGVTGRGSHTGVHGRGEYIGVSGETFDPDSPASPISSDGPESVAVLGQADNGTAVQGRSKHGRGGWFSSDSTCAQVRLEPKGVSKMVELDTPTPLAVTSLKDGGRLPLPKRGRAGDLYSMRVELARATDETQRFTCTLWFCVQGAGQSDPDLYPAQWAQILTSGSSIAGTE